MPAPANLIDQPHGLGNAKLGRRFWVMWWAGFVLLNTIFIGALTLVAPRMGSLVGAIAGGVTVLVFTSALIALCMTPMRVLQKRGLEGRMRPAYRRYMWRFLPAMFGYVILLIGAILYMKTYQPDGVSAWLAGLAPSLPVLLAIRAIVMLPQDEDDEFLRAGIYQTSAWATGGTLAICSVYGFLDLFGLVPHVELWVVFPIWAVCLAFAQAIRARRFK